MSMIIGKIGERVRRVKTGAALSPEHAMDLDYALMFLAHLETETDPTPEQEFEFTEFQKDVIEKWDLLSAAYNCGSYAKMCDIENWKERWVKRFRTCNLYSFSSLIDHIYTLVKQEHSRERTSRVWDAMRMDGKEVWDSLRAALLLLEVTVPFEGTFTHTRYGTVCI